MVQVASDDAIAPARGTCRTCRAENAMLHHDPNEPNEARRTVCATCQGNANRIAIDRLNGRGGYQ